MMYFAASDLSFGYLAASFLFPLLPAFLLFRFLPSKANVSGPLKGLEVKLGGAFAGYFMLFIIVFSTFSSWFKRPDDKEEVWTISGNIISRDHQFSVQEDKPTFWVNPVAQRFQSRRFEVKVIATAFTDGLLDFPMLTLNTLNYKDADLPSLTFNKLDKNIDTSFVIESLEGRRIRLKYPLIIDSKSNTATLFPGSDTAGSHVLLTVDTSSAN